jgi:hypothetical protein
LRAKANGNNLITQHRVNAEIEGPAAWVAILIVALAAIISLAVFGMYVVERLTEPRQNISPARHRPAAIDRQDELPSPVGTTPNDGSATSRIE